MKQTIDIGSGSSVTFNAGQSGKYFILRQASQSVILKGDNLRPVELVRGDVVDVSNFDELDIYNPNATSVHVEFQVADVEVRIRTASTSIDGALEVNEIHNPVEISRIQEEVQVSVTNQAEDTATGIRHRGNLMVRDSATTFASNPLRKGLIFYAPKTNQEDVVLNSGIFLSPGGHVFIPLSGSIYYLGHEGDRVHITELLK